MSEHEDFRRLYGYVERFFARSGKTAWPTVRQAARSLGWKQEYVLSLIEDGCSSPDLPDDCLFLSSHPGGCDAMADHFIESTGEA
jgi:hypothetical protein